MPIIEVPGAFVPWRTVPRGCAQRPVCTWELVLGDKALPPHRQVGPSEDSTLGGHRDPAGPSPPPAPSSSPVSSPEGSAASASEHGPPAGTSAGHRPPRPGLLRVPLPHGDSWSRDSGTLKVTGVRRPPALRCPWPNCQKGLLPAPGGGGAYMPIGGPGPGRAQQKGRPGLRGWRPGRPPP